jgi:3-hydroxyacyl-CoA dehydrogenase
MKHPERVCIAHPFNPPHLIPLVEIVGGNKTQSRFVESVRQFFVDIGKKPIVVKKEVPGHIANRLQAALMREILYLAKENIASIEDIDSALTDGPGLRYACLGQNVLFHLGGGESGAEGFSKHILPSLLRWVSPEDADFNEELRAQWVKGTVDATKNESIESLAAKRDKLLIDIIKKKYSN